MEVAALGFRNPISLYIAVLKSELSTLFMLAKSSASELHLWSFNLYVFI